MPRDRRSRTDVWQNPQTAAAVGPARQPPRVRRAGPTDGALAPPPRTAAPPAAHRAGSWRAARRACPTATSRPALHHHDAVRMADRREPVGDDQHRAAGHQPFERELDHALALGVERARRFVEQQDRTVGEDRARDREALPLSAREAHAALAEIAGVTLRQLLRRTRRRTPPRRRRALRLRSPRAGRSARSRATLAAKITGSCGTTARRRRTSRGSALRTSTPSMRTTPACGS